MSDIVDRIRLVEPADNWLDQNILDDAVEEIELLRRAVIKMAGAAGPAYTPHWVQDASWYREGP